MLTSPTRIVTLAERLQIDAPLAVSIICAVSVASTSAATATLRKSGVTLTAGRVSDTTNSPLKIVLRLCF
jgi:hypothetical protein